MKNFRTLLNQKLKTINSKHARGFTLVEILAALLVLLIGLSAIMVLLYGSFQEGRSASDRNAACVILPEAARAIEQDHLLDASTISTYGIDPLKTGMLVQTITNAPERDAVAPYSSIQINNKPTVTLNKPTTLTGTNLNQWPREKPYFFGGDANTFGTQYRVRYRLEKHPAWCPTGDEAAENRYSMYRGVYVLTMVVYAADERSATSPVYKQVSDPVVTYLRDKKSR